MAHAILFVQPGKPETRTYSDFESVNECMEGVCHLFEDHLKRQNPNTGSITYDISQLFDFIDNLEDLSCLVPDFPPIFFNEYKNGFFKLYRAKKRFQKSTLTYAPYNKDWIKEKIYILLRRQATKSQ